MKLLESKNIWANDLHCAFTDLIYFDNQFFCAFREASTHMSFDGIIKILISSDGQNWELHSSIKLNDIDLRDPKFSITSEGKLMLNVGERKQEEKKAIFSSLNFFLEKNNKWSEAFRCETGINTWRWSTTWHKNKAYSMAYTGKHKLGAIFNSVDGIKWDLIQDNIFPKALERGNETSIVFKSNDAYCLLRRDGGTHFAMLGFSKPPYDSWEWKDLKQYIGGPKMLQLKDDFLVSGRFFQNKEVFTAIGILNPRSLEFEKFLKLPSLGDCSYPGLVLKDDIVYISYYSSFEDKKTAIYFAKVKL